jgi:exoribonuclease R
MLTKMLGICFKMSRKAYKEAEPILEPSWSSLNTAKLLYQRRIAAGSIHRKQPHHVLMLLKPERNVVSFPRIPLNKLECSIQILTAESPSLVAAHSYKS